MANQAHTSMSDYAHKGERNGSWCRRNWILLALILLGLAGLAFALVGFIEPCLPTIQLVPTEVPKNITETVLEPYVEILNETETITVTNETTIIVPRNVTVNDTRNVTAPLQFLVGLDESGSIRDHFDSEIEASKTLIRTVGELITKKEALFQAGAYKWNNGNPVILTAATFDLNSVYAGLDNTQYNSGGTAFGSALLGCIEQLLGLEDLPHPDGLKTAKVCTILSDGVSLDSGVVYGAGNYVEQCRNNVELTSLRNACSGSTIEGNPASKLATFCTSKLISPCTSLTVADYLKSQGMIIAAVFIKLTNAPQDETNLGTKQLYEHTSCTEKLDLNDIDCPLFSTTELDKLESTAAALAESVISSVTNTTVITEEVTTVVNRTETRNETYTYTQNKTRITQVPVTKIVNETVEIVSIPQEICTSSEYWFFLLALFIPLLIYLLWRPISLFLSRYCCPPKDALPMLNEPLEEPFLHEYQEPMQRDPSLKLEQPFTPIVPQVLATPPLVARPESVEPPYIAPEPNTLKTEKRYRWSIKAADRYLWNLGAAGVAPLTVNFGGKAPPSAPKEEAIEKNMKRRTQRISMRWSYVPQNVPEDEPVMDNHRSSRSRKTISHRIQSAMGVTPFEVPQRLEPFEEHEVQPGDIDYEYTMCLMRFCPCLRPKTASIKEVEQIMEKRHTKRLSDNPKHDGANRQSPMSDYSNQFESAYTSQYTNNTGRFNNNYNSLNSGDSSLQFNSSFNDTSSQYSNSQPGNNLRRVDTDNSNYPRSRYYTPASGVQDVPDDIEV